MEWHDLDSDSDVSSVWSSDDEEASRPASPAELRRAYFSSATLPEDAPRNDMLLRKQHSAYVHTQTVTEASPILPQHAGDPKLASLDDFFGVPGGHDREVAGILVDANGKPYAKIMESKPPPPNTNRLGQSHQRSLRRALGYDPHIQHRKTEVSGITNAPDPLNGDADLQHSRRDAKSTLLRRGDAFHNKTHMHDISDVDAGRSMYDGYNIASSSRDFTKRRHHLEHTWRNTGKQEHDPVRAESQIPDASPHNGYASTRRTETGVAFHRAPKVTHSTVQLDSTMAIPVISHKSMREGDARFGRVAESHIHGSRTLSAPADIPDGDREMQEKVAGRDVTVSARRAEAANAERQGSDVDVLQRQEAATALVGLGNLQAALVGDHVVSEDVVPARESMATAHVGASAQHAVHIANGTDVQSVHVDTGVHSGIGDRAAASLHDSLETERSSTDGRVATHRAGGGSLEAQSCLDIGEDRPPITSSATWHFPHGKGEGADRYRPSHAPTKSLAGSCFINDRLDQPHATDWYKYEYRVKAGVDEVGQCERTTMLSHDRGAEPPSRQVAVATRLSQSGSVRIGGGRSTPIMRSETATPISLR